MFKEFKEFIARGNAMDLAVAVVIGAAFGLIIKSFVDNLLMPIVGIFGKVDFSYLVAHLGTAPTAPVLKYGTFISDVVNFVIVMFALFLVVKAMNRIKRPDVATPDSKQCPYCLSSIPVGATRCSACTSQLDGVPADGSAPAAEKVVLT